MEPNTDYWYIFAVVHTILFNVLQGVPLNTIISHYETLDYDVSPLRSRHYRVKRGTDADLSLNFQAFGRDFYLRLRADNQVFSDDVIFETSSGKINFDTSRTYTGVDKAFNGGKAQGIVTSLGHFEGHISHDNETYYIEGATRHFSSARDFHSIIYRHSDVNYDFNQAFCKSDELHAKLRKQFNYKNHDNLQEETKWSDRYKPRDQERAERKKRDIVASKTVCELYLQADHTYYEKFGSNAEVVIDQLSKHVQAINPMFNSIDFDKDGSPDNIGFIVKRLKIYTDSSAAGYKFSGTYSVEKFLDLHSKDNYDDFCLSIMFTYRDFNNGILGLAWTAHEEYAGGVCEKYRSYKGEYKSLNSAIVTTLNYGSDVSSAVSYTTLAHEIGHNYGSLHDSDSNPTCAPGGSQGNYIMYAMATSGYQTNNVKFSSCSVDYMKPILESKARHSGGCFQAPKNSLCGNKIKEGTEECDCGWEDECTEGCCNPQVTAANASTPTPCTRKTGACSPSEGLCCSPSCALYTAGENHECRSNTSCVASANCDGTSVHCPDPQPAANGTSCGDDRVCYLGECTGSLCLAHGMTSCQCEVPDHSDWSDKTLCKLCCVYNETCLTSDKIPGLMSNTEAKAVIGSPCNDYKGYCDVFHVCRQVKPSGPLSILTDLVFSGKLVETMKEWLTKNWYIAVAAGVGFIILMALFVKLCSKSHGPPKNLVRPSPSRHGNYEMNNTRRHARY